MLFLSDWLTDVAFLHLSIVNDQSFDMLDGYRMQTSSPGHTLDTTQCSVHAPVFTSRVHPRLRFSLSKLLCSCTSLSSVSTLAKRSLKCYLSFTATK